MSSYNAWDSFNEKEELRKTDARFESEDFRDDQKKSLDGSVRELQDATFEAKREAEVLYARTQVEALRNAHAASGGGAARRRRAKAAAAVTVDPDAHTSSSSSSSPMSKVGNEGENKEAPSLKVSAEELEGLIVNTSAPVLVTEDVSATFGTHGVATADGTATHNLALITRLTSLINECTASFSGILRQSEVLSKACASGSHPVSAASPSFSSSSSTTSTTFSSATTSSSFSSIWAITSSDASICYYGVELLKDTEVFSLTKLQCAKGAEGDVLAAGLISEAQKSFNVIKRMEDSIQRLSLQMTTLTAVAALRCGHYALSCDLTRHYLRRHQILGDSMAEKAAIALAKQSKNNSDGDGFVATAATERDDKDSALALVWMCRALALCGMRCPYLANVHAKKASDIYEAYPRIKNVIDKLDCYEMTHMMHCHQSPLEVLVNEEVRSIVKCYSSKCDSATNANVAKGTVATSFSGGKSKGNSSSAEDALVDPHAITDEMLAALLGPDMHDLNAGDVFTPHSALHMQEFDEVDDNYNRDRVGTSTSTSTSTTTAATSATTSTTYDASRKKSAGAAVNISIEDIISSIKSPNTSTSASTSINSDDAIDILAIFRCLHEAFYQAQLIYLEQLYLTAEVRYLGVILTACATSRAIDIAMLATEQEYVEVDAKAKVKQRCGHFPTTALGDSSMAKTYLTAVQIACLINAGVSRIRRGCYRTGTTVRSNVTGTQSLLAALISSSSSELTLRHLTQCSAIDLSIAALHLSSSNTMPYFAAGYMRAVEIHEISEQFDGAMLLLDHLEAALVAKWEGHRQVQGQEQEQEHEEQAPPSYRFVEGYDHLQTYSQHFLTPFQPTRFDQIRTVNKTKLGLDPELSQGEVRSRKEYAMLMNKIQKTRERLAVKRTKFLGVPFTSK